MGGGTTENCSSTFLRAPSLTKSAPGSADVLGSGSTDFNSLPELLRLLPEDETFPAFSAEVCQPRSEYSAALEVLLVLFMAARSVALDRHLLQSQE